MLILKIHPVLLSRFADDSLLRRRLRNALDELQDHLPIFDDGKLLSELCSLLRSPLFLYTIGPRLRAEDRKCESPVTGILTPQSLPGEHLSNDAQSSEKRVDMEKLNIVIKWDGKSWATRLCYGESMIIEGRQYQTTQDAGFLQSFHWFCEETEFLYCEFRARENAAAGVLTDKKPVEVGFGETRAMSSGNKKRRIVKLKIRADRMDGERRLRPRNR